MTKTYLRRWIFQSTRGACTTPTTAMPSRTLRPESGCGRPASLCIVPNRLILLSVFLSFSFVLLLSVFLYLNPFLSPSFFLSSFFGL